MNTGMSFFAIASLLLAMAMAGESLKQQARGTSSAPTHNRNSVDRIAINHNETMVSDVALIQQASLWLTNLRSFVVTKFATYTRGGKGGCEEFGCGGNHNETMVSDVAFVEPASLWFRWFVVAQFGTYARGGKGGCDEFGCGMNHNETMVSDVPFVEPASLWFRWFVVTQFGTYARGGKGGCDEWGCGTNHNETLIADVTR